MRIRYVDVWTLVVFLSLTACESRQSVETELRINELEAQVAELELQLDQAWTQVSQMSTELTTGVNNLEAALDDVNRRVMDLPAGDPQFTIPEVEASLAVAIQRLAAVRGTTQELATYVSP